MEREYKNYNLTRYEGTYNPAENIEKATLNVDITVPNDKKSIEGIRKLLALKLLDVAIHLLDGPNDALPSSGSCPNEFGTAIYNINMEYRKQ
jgi:hypothetical protein